MRKRKRPAPCSNGKPATRKTACGVSRVFGTHAKGVDTGRPPSSDGSDDGLEDFGLSHPRAPERTPLPPSVIFPPQKHIEKLVRASTHVPGAASTFDAGRVWNTSPKKAILHCRPADEHDFAALAELRWAHEAEEGGLRGADKDGFMTAFLAFLARNLKNGSYMFWVAEEKGRIVANISVGIVPKVPRPMEMNGKIGYVTPTPYLENMPKPGYRQPPAGNRPGMGGVGRF